MHTRNLEITKELIREILIKKPRDFATEEEKKEYDFFNIIIEQSFKIIFKRPEECCRQTIEERWSYCPICGEYIEENEIYIRNVSNEKEAIKKICEKGYTKEEIKKIKSIFSIDLAMEKRSKE